MNIGIIGTGNMGRALGLRWAGAGHPVLFGSRDPDKAKAIAARGGGSTRAGDFDEAAAFGDVVVYTARDVFPSSLLTRPRALAGKIVIDCNNHDLGLDRPPPIPSLAERLAADVPEARIVKAFNTIPHVVIELAREEIARHRVSVFLCSDDAAAKTVVKGLAEELGFVGVDAGALVRGRLVDGVADFIRYQIGATGLGPLATISLEVLRPEKRGAP